MKYKFIFILFSLLLILAGCTQDEEIPLSKVSSEQVKLITPDMKYDDIIELLGNTKDIGSGVYVLEYIVDEDKILLISLLSKNHICGKTGEELLTTLKSNNVK